MPNVNENERGADYPLDPARPLELDDGRPVEVVRFGHDYVIVRFTGPWLRGQDFADTETWTYSRADGVWHGGSAEDFFTLRHADPSAPPVPAWKREARIAAYSRTKEERVPWQDAPWHKGEAAELHFAHLVMVDGTPMVAFYQSERHAEAGRLTKMRPGRYLQRYFGQDLKNEEIEQQTAEVTVQAGAMTVQWTQDADEIETIYVNGPSSCMSHDADEYRGHCHPTRVYAGPDLAVAWLGDMDDATARAIVWPDRKIYDAVYGDVSRMTRLLEAQGFTCGSFAGARIRRIRDEYGNGLIMPYLDIASYAYDEGDYVRLGSGTGSYVECNSTSGTTEDNSYTCERCEDSVSEDDIQTVYVGGRWEDTEAWCEHCADHHATYCDSRELPVAHTHVEVHAVNGGPRFMSNVSEDRLDREGFVWVESRDEWWHVDRTFTCEDCGEVFHEDDRDGRNTGADLCEGCADERAEDGDEGNVVPALQSESELLAAEAAGQMRLPLEVPGFHVMRDGAAHPARVTEVDTLDPTWPLRIAFADEGNGRWFAADGSPAYDDGARLINIPPELIARCPQPLAIAA